MEKSKNKIETELNDIINLVSGEKDLREREDKLQKLKKAAKKKQKNVERESIKKKEKVLDNDFEKEEEKVVQNIKLYSWEAPVRFKYPFNPKSFIIIVSLSLLFIVYLVILGNYGLMAAIIALLFFVYVTGTVEPYSIKHTITRRGVDTVGRLYEWFLLDTFWFTKKDDQYLLVLDTKLRSPKRLLLLLSKEEVSVLFVLLQDKLVYKEIKKQSWIEKQNYGEYIKLDDIV